MAPDDRGAADPVPADATNRMKFCPNCQTQYPDDANFCPQEGCATGQGPRRLEPLAAAVPAPPPPRYELEAQLGGSRSGEVFRARDNQTGQTVAYKLVAQASLPTTATLERAQRELKQLQRAQSPRLARVLDFGKDADGRLFIASELCDGQPLDQLVASSGPLPLDRAKAIVAQIGEALLEGQKVGVVHHDLSPKNVLVSGNDEVKVINFVAPVAVSETVFGVAEYLSPEQAEGKLVDQRSNTYSLGGILLLLLSGRPPVSGADTGAILDQVTKGELVPPSRRVEGNTTLTPEIDRIVMKAMDKSPNRRPLTMRQFLTEVSGMVALGAAPAPGGGGVGFAKTMLFSGGSPDVQKLVQQAIAARGGAAASPAPAPAPAPEPAPAYAATPPPAAQAPAPTGPRRTHGAAIAATVVSLPAAKLPGMATPMPGSSPNQSGQVTPPPVAATPAPQLSPGTGPAPTPKPAAGGNFRETLWFKKGDVDQMVAEARQRVEAARAKGIAVPDPEGAVAAVVGAELEAGPLDERYVDDGSVTVDDRKKFSLRSGATSTALPTVGGAIPGERMSDAEVMAEVGGKKRITIIAVAVAVVALLGILAWNKLRAKDVVKNAAALTPTEIPAQAPPAEVTPPPAPPAPPVAAGKPPAAAAAKDTDEPTPKAARTPPAAKKHAASKSAKAKGKKAHK
jgi:eukaryotic-like serine/threonine-protein kinase